LIEMLYRFVERESRKGGSGAQLGRQGLLAWLLDGNTADLRVIAAQEFGYEAARKTWKAKTVAGVSSDQTALLVFNQAAPDVANIVTVKITDADGTVLEYRDALPLETGDAYIVPLKNMANKVADIEVSFRKTPKGRGAGLAVSKARWTFGEAKAVVKKTVAKTVAKKAVKSDQAVVKKASKSVKTIAAVSDGDDTEEEQDEEENEQDE
jgi:hypothetical protein